MAEGEEGGSLSQIRQAPAQQYRYMKRKSILHLTLAHRLRPTRIILPLMMPQRVPRTATSPVRQQLQHLGISDEDQSTIRNTTPRLRSGGTSTLTLSWIWEIMGMGTTARRRRLLRRLRRIWRLICTPVQGVVPGEPHATAKRDRRHQDAGPAGTDRPISPLLRQQRPGHRFCSRLSTRATLSWQLQLPRAHRYVTDNLLVPDHTAHTRLGP